MRTLIAFVFVALLAGCTTTERQESIQRKSLKEVAAAFPVGMPANSISKAAEDRGWKLSSDQMTTDWSGPDKSVLVDRVFTVSLPKHAGVPFSFAVFGYVGSKGGSVVVQHVVVEANAL